MAEGTSPPQGTTRFVETTRGILTYQQLAPLLAEQVLLVQEQIEAQAFAGFPLREDLLQELHRGFSQPLVPS